MKKFVHKDWADICIATLLSIVFSVLFVIIFACLLKWFEWSDNCIAPVNIGIRMLAILLGCVFGIRSGSKGIIKGVFVGTFFTLITYCVYSLILSDWSVNPMTVYDFIFNIIGGLVSGVVAVNMRKSTSQN